MRIARPVSIISALVIAAAVLTLAGCQGYPTPWAVTGNGSASWIAGASWPGGSYLDCRPSGVSNASTGVTLISAPVAVEPDSDVFVRVAVEFEVASRSVSVWPAVRFLHVDGTQIGLDHPGDLVSESVNTAWSFYGSADTYATVPFDAASAVIVVHIFEAGSYSPSNGARIGQARLVTDIRPSDIEPTPAN